MRLFRRRINESMAAATAVKATFATVEKHCALKRTMEERFKDLPAFLAYAQSVPTFFSPLYEAIR